MSKTYEEIMNIMMHSNAGFEHVNKITNYCDNNEPFDAASYIKNTFECSQEDAQHVVKDVYDYMLNARKKYASNSDSKPIKDINTPTCPKCGSTAITTTSRGVGFIRGFLGANETVNRCGNCSYTWKPSKWL